MTGSSEFCDKPPKRRRKKKKNSQFRANIEKIKERSKKTIFKSERAGAIPGTESGGACKANRRSKANESIINKTIFLQNCNAARACELEKMGREVNREKLPRKGQGDRTHARQETDAEPWKRSKPGGRFTHKPRLKIDMMLTHL